MRATVKTLDQVIFLGLVSVACFAAENGYVGRRVCAGCHSSIAARQAKTRMARTWQGSGTAILLRNYAAAHSEGAWEHRVTRSGRNFSFILSKAGESALQFPIETTLGGDRHGLSFLFKVPEIAGIALPRAPLIEGRYLYSVTWHGFALSPGFPNDTPSTLETALGRPLPLNFEKSVWLVMANHATTVPIRIPA